MFGQTSSNTIKNPFGSTTKFQFGGQTSTSLWGAPTGSSSSSTGIAAFGASSAETSRSFGEFVTTTHSAPRGNTGFAFGTTSTAFGTSTLPAFGQKFGASRSPFGAQSTSQAFGTSTSPAFGQAFGASSSPFGAQSTNPAFGTSTIPAFGQKFGAPSSPFGAQSTTQSIRNSVSVGGQRQGSRVDAYKSTLEQDLGTANTCRFQSITAMPVYESKSLEELRFEDYELGDKGGKTTMKASTPCNTTPSFRFPQTSSTPATNLIRTPTPAPPFSSISQPFSNPFSTSNTSPSPYSSISQPSSNPFSTSNKSPSPFSSISQPFANPFSTSNTSPSLFPSRTSSQATQTSSSSPSPTVASSTPATNIFKTPTPTPPFSSISQPFSNPFSTSNSIPPPSSSSSSSPSIVSSTPAIDLFKTPPTPTPPIFPNTQPFSNPFNTTNITPPPFSFPSWTSSQVTSPSPPVTYTFTRPIPSIPPTQTSISTPAQSPFSTPGSNIVNPTQPQPSNTPVIQQNDLVQQQQKQQQQQQQHQQKPVLVVPATNPFGTPRATPQVPNGGTVQYGISSIPVVDRPARASVNVSSLSAARSQIRRQMIGFPADGCKSRRHDLYKNKNGTSHPKVPFFSDDADQVPKTPKIRL